MWKTEEASPLHLQAHAPGQFPFRVLIRKTGEVSLLKGFLSEKLQVGDDMITKIAQHYGFPSAGRRQNIRNLCEYSCSGESRESIDSFTTACLAREKEIKASIKTWKVAFGIRAGRMDGNAGGSILRPTASL